MGKRIQQIATAHHEAGHAVAHLVLEHASRLESVTIEPTEGYLGRTISEALGFDPGVSSEEEAEHDATMKAEIVATYAGSIAETKYLGRDVDVGSEGDYGRIHEYTLFISGSEEDTQRIVDEARIRAEKLIEEHWPAVEAIAALLLAGTGGTGTITGEEARECFERVTR